MKIPPKSMLIVLLSLLLLSCSSATANKTMAEIAIKAIADIDISHSEIQCPRIKNNCSANGNYEEWTQEDGSLACACNN